MSLGSGRRRSRPRVWVFLAVVLAVANLLLLAHFELPGHLSRREQEDDLHRLAHLSVRMPVVAAPGRLVQRTLTLTDRCGTPGGEVFTTQIDRGGSVAGPEVHLAFALGLSRATARPPERRVAPWVELRRVERGTDLVPRRHRDLLRLQLAEEPAAEPQAVGVLMVDNLKSPLRRRRSDSAPLPVLAELIEGSHCKLGPEDLDLMTHLAPSLRARICDDLDSTATRCYAPVILLVRDRRPGELVLRLTASDTRLGHLDLHLLVRDGQISYARRGPVTLTKAAHLLFVPPTPAGEPLDLTAPGLHALRYEPTGGTEPDLHGQVDLASLR